MLNKIKNLIMKKDQKVIDGKVYDNETDAWVDPADLTPTSDNPDPAGYGDEEEPLVTDDEIEAAKEQLAEQNIDVTMDTEMTEIEDLSDDERAEMQNLTADDPEYLEFSAEAVGYENRQNQWDMYRIVSSYMEDGDSVLDFGAGRGDFERFYQTEYQLDIDYTGIEMNQQLVDASKKAYNSEVELICKDWFKIDRDLSADWCTNINSSNLRYDADTTRTDEIYLKDTINKMMQHCQKGCILILSSDIPKVDDGLINFNPGDLLNWAQSEYKNVALDHSYAEGVFTLVIYK